MNPHGFFAPCAVCFQQFAVSVVAWGAEPKNDLKPGRVAVARDTARTSSGTTWEITVEETDPATGVVTTRSGAYEELASGLNHPDEKGVWQRSDPSFVPVKGGGYAALLGLHKVRLAADLNDPTAVEITTGDETLLRSAPLALGYFDPLSGKTITIARLRATSPTLVATNVVVYADAFDSVHASVRYSNYLDGIHQDIVLHELPAPPESFGLSAGSRMEVLTEFASDTVGPTKETRVIAEEGDQARRPVMAEPDFVDETLTFGADAFLGPGRAFSTESESGTGTGSSIRVGKRFLQIGDRKILVEAVPWPQLKALFGARAKEGAWLPSAVQNGQVVSGRQVRPRTRVHVQTQVAASKRPYHGRGVVIDYELKSGTVSTFQFDTGKTYLITAPFTVGSGALTLQAASVVKFAPGSSLTFTSTLVCPTSGASPAVLTSMHDNSIGELISGSTGYPAILTGTVMLGVYYPTYAPTVQTLTFRWAGTGVGFPSWAPAGTPGVVNSRFENCATAVSAAPSPTLFLNNLKTCAVATPYSGGSYTGNGFTVDCLNDTDSDGLADAWENANFNQTLIYNAAADPDGDGWTNAEEAANGTNPLVPQVNLGEPLRASSRRTGLVISEIMHTPDPTLPGLSGKPFVEIYNSDPWPVAMAGYRLEADLMPSGIFTYTFPNTSTVGPGNCVVAEVPGMKDGSGLVRLYNASGALLLEVKYANDPPWPRTASVAGHSLVLYRASYGENDPRAWTASDKVGGSPGRPERFEADPLRSVVINEFLANPSSGQGQDFIELFNTSAQPVSIAGCWLSCRTETLVVASLSSFLIPAGTTLAAGQRMAFVKDATSSFTFGLGAAGDAIYLSKPDPANPSKPLRVIDAIKFGPQRAGVSLGRFPDGTATYLPLTPSAGAANTTPWVPPVVINEIMYHPLDDDPTAGPTEDDLQYIELKGPAGTSLSGWKLDDGVKFTFLPGAAMPSSGYVVIAKNPSALQTRYGSTLNTPGTVFGWDAGSMLSGSGERISLVDGAGYQVDEVTYSSAWGRWSDGGGSSLELKDSLGDNRQGSDWGDSDETAKSAWPTAPLEFVDYRSFAFPYDTTPSSGNLALDFILLGAGECLIDDVLATGSDLVSNRVSNPDFNGGATGWTASGNHLASAYQASGGVGGTGCYRVRTESRGDNQYNRLRADLSAAIIPDPALQGKLALKARWQRGNPEFVLRVGLNQLELAGKLTVPVNLGTPGIANSQAVANVGPSVDEVAHAPVLPTANQSVAITARCWDPQGVAGVVLKYRVDPGGAEVPVTMLDNGVAPDAVAGDRLYTASIPGQVAGTLVAFYVQATDVAGTPVTSTYPADSPASACLVRWGEVTPPGVFPTYRFWARAAEVTAWSARNHQDSRTTPLTLVYGDSRVIYGAAASYAGSDLTTRLYNGPAGKLCHYGVRLPDDGRLLGDNETRLEFPPFDASLVAERTGYRIVEQMGLPAMRRRYIHVHFNGVTQGTRANPFLVQNPAHPATQPIYEETQRPDGAFIKSWYPTWDTSLYPGAFHLLEVWEENLADAGNPLPPAPANLDARLRRYANTAGQHKLASYRWNWLPRPINPLQSGHDFTKVFSLVDSADATLGSVSAFKAVADSENWMRTMALARAIGHTDSFGWLYQHKGTSRNPNICIINLSNVDTENGIALAH